MSASAPRDRDLIDLSVLSDLVGTDQAKIRKFALKFVETTRSGLAEMASCLAVGDVNRIRELGHRVKSAARLVGAFGMGELCEQLEKMPHAAPAQELQEAARLIALLDPLLAQVAALIETTPSSA
jgi:HPt (histidine-containing phosphotransfer) domain-containing protein